MSLPIQPILSRDPKSFDESPVVLNADQQAASAKAIGEVIGALSSSFVNWRAKTNFKFRTDTTVSTSPNRN
jgi:hypothetical protein